VPDQTRVRRPLNAEALGSLEMIRDSGKLKFNREISEGQCNGRTG